MKLNSFFLLLLLLPISYAIEINSQSDSFQVFTNSLTQGCRCSEVEDIIIVQNIGSYGSYYILESEITSNSNQLFLEPGKQGEFIVYYPKSCENNEEKFNFKITSTYGSVKEFSKSFKTGMCQNLMVYGTSDDQVCFDKTNYYNITVTNIGSFTEEYELFSGDYFHNFSLEPSNTINVLVEMNNTGEANTSFTVKAINNKLKAKISFPGFKSCYSNELRMEESYSICQGVSEEIVLMITNNNLSRDTFDLETNFGELNNASFSLEEGESKDLKLSLLFVDAISEVLKLKIYSSTNTKTYYINISSVNCNIPKLIINNQKLCESPVEVIIENTGELSGEYIVSVFNDSKEITIDANSSISVDFGIINASDFSREETVTVYLKGHEELSDKESFKINYQTLNSCYKPKLSKSSLVIKPHYEYVGLFVKPEGFQADYYEVELNSEILSLESGNISIPESLIFNVDKSKSFGIYESNLTLTYKEQVYQFVITVNYRDYTEFEKIFISFAESNIVIPSLIIISLIILLLLSSFIVKLTKIKKKFNKNQYIFIPVLAFIFFVGFVVSTPLDLQEPNSNESLLYFEFFVNESLTLDLNKFISDADSDNISFFYNGSEDILVNYSFVRVTSNSLDQFVVMFYANDAVGVIESPLFTFQPVLREEKTLTEWINIYSNYVYLVLALFLIGSVHIFTYSIHKISKKK